MNDYEKFMLVDSLCVTLNGIMGHALVYYDSMAVTKVFLTITSKYGKSN